MKGRAKNDLIPLIRVGNTLLSADRDFDTIDNLSVNDVFKITFSLRSEYLIRYIKVEINRIIIEKIYLIFRIFFFKKINDIVSD